ncbi:uncharacterized protein LOC122313758 isoform X2 [Carya illinoinensis]|uniref:uncharacterized protein LOC122313758 isoform X2 n=1 Tax=Carya illinoinensis TaxID=32201 RepID=UPI001C71A011|nr:uncharacterized protein LOC122313758 isoform X2 [Carya illinoinensis]
MGLPNPIAQVGGYVCGSVCVYLVRTCMILVEAVQVFKHANVGVSVCIFGAHVHAWYWLKLYNFFKHVSVGMGGCKLVGEHVFRHLHVHVCRCACVYGFGGSCTFLQACKGGWLGVYIWCTCACMVLVEVVQVFQKCNGEWVWVGAGLQVCVSMGVCPCVCTCG